MTRVTLSGQPGNTVPISERSSTDTLLLDYQLGIRRPVVAIDALTYTVMASQTGTLFTYGGQSCGVTITLPLPETGLWFEFAATGAIATAVTVIKGATTDTLITAGGSGGVDSLVSEATSAEFGIAGGGLYLELIGVSTTRYVVRQWAGGTTAAADSTAQWKASS